MTTLCTDLPNALASGQRVRLQDIIGARRAVARGQRTAADALRDARAAERTAAAALARHDALTLAEAQADAETLRALGAHGVYARCLDGGLYRMGGLSDMDIHYRTGDPIVEVDIDGHRRWLPRADVVLV